MRPAPRLFGIPARDAPVVAVLRRGPSSWCHVGRWDVGPEPSYAGGTWLRGTLYPQRCDLSPDGRYLCYFALSASADWAPGSTYIALSRLPWLTALAAWGTAGTWTRGFEIVEDPSSWPLGDPESGDATPFRERYGIDWVRPASFAVERRRGWTETADSPPADAQGDPWDERRADRVTMSKPGPGGRPELQVAGAYAAFRTFDSRFYGTPDYWLVGEDGTRTAMPGTQWADWTADGRLLVATSDGRLQVRTGTDVEWEQDLAAMEPDPQPPPAEATRW